MHVVKTFSEIGEEIMQTLKTRHVTRSLLAAVAYTLLVMVSMAFAATANI